MYCSVYSWALAVPFNHTGVAASLTINQHQNNIVHHLTQSRSLSIQSTKKK